MILVALAALGISLRGTIGYGRRSREAASMEADYRDEVKRTEARLKALRDEFRALPEGSPRLVSMKTKIRDEADLLASWEHLALWANTRKVKFARAATHFWEGDPGEIAVTPMIHPARP